MSVASLLPVSMRSLRVNANARKKVSVMRRVSIKDNTHSEPPSTSFRALTLLLVARETCCMKDVEKRQVEGDVWKVKSRPAIVEGNFTYT